MDRILDYGSSDRDSNSLRGTLALVAQLARAADSNGVVYRDKPGWYRLVVGRVAVQVQTQVRLLLPALNQRVLGSSPSESTDKYIKCDNVVMQFDVREESTDWGTVWYITDNGESLRFALHMYDDDPDTVYLTSVFVKEQYRKLGLGNVILSMAEDIGKQLDAKVIMLNVLKNSFMHDWYERHGYSDFVVNDEDLNYIWMKKSLS